MSFILNVHLKTGTKFLCIMSFFNHAPQMTSQSSRRFISYKPNQCLLFLGIVLDRFIYYLRLDFFVNNAVNSSISSFMLKPSHELLEIVRYVIIQLIIPFHLHNNIFFFQRFMLSVLYGCYLVILITFTLKVVAVNECPWRIPRLDLICFWNGLTLVPL